MAAHDAPRRHARHTGRLDIFLVALHHGRAPHRARVLHPAGERDGDDQHAEGQAQAHAADPGVAEVGGGVGACEQAHRDVVRGEARQLHVAAVDLRQTALFIREAPKLDQCPGTESAVFARRGTDSAEIDAELACRGLLVWSELIIYRISDFI
mgnify:CR=1 FL=1